MLFSAIFFALFACVFSNSSDNKITIQLQNVNILERLGLTGKNDTHGAAYDGRLDTILALGTNVYTARLGVGTPPQPVDFLLNFVGDLISPGVGDLSFVLTPKALGQNGSEDVLVLFGQNANGTRTFNNSASKTFKSHPDIIFKTTIQPTSLNFSLTGFIGEDIIMFNNITEERNITVRERSFGQVVQIHESNLLEQFSISGMLNMGKQSAVMERIRIRPYKIQLAYAKTEAQLMFGATPLTNEFCESSGSYRYYDLVKDFGNETGLGMDTFRFKIEGVALKAPDMEYDDKIVKTVLVDPNNMFIRAPKRIVAKLALMINAQKRKIGRHQLYMIDCNEPYGPFTFKTRYNDIKLEKENLKIKLPGNLLPPGQCLWAIQELDDSFWDNVNASWIFGRPFFQQKHCLVIDPEQNIIGFPKYLGKY